MAQIKDVRMMKTLQNIRYSFLHGYLIPLAKPLEMKSKPLNKR